MRPPTSKPGTSGNSSRQDIWPAEREGYSDMRRVAYAPAAALHIPERNHRNRAEERIASLIAGAGLIWGAQLVTKDFAGITRISLFPPGPLEICAIGFLLWLHAKWRRAIKER